MKNWFLIHRMNPVSSMRQWLSSVEIYDPKIAHFLCKLIPAQCPFARKIKLFNHTIADIPPLCKLNPFYQQIVEIRFKSLTFLADQCGEDITFYC
jgi:hypothetical protein